MRGRATADAVSATLLRPCGMGGSLFRIWQALNAPPKGAGRSVMREAVERGARRGPAASRGCSRPRAPRRRAGREPRQRRASSRKPRPVTSIVGERVVGVRVEAGRDEQQVGLEADAPPARPISSNARRYSSSPEPAGSGTLTRRLVPLVRPARARIERPLVDRHVEDGRVVAEDVLRAVAVVDVPVDDRHALEPELGLRRARRDRDVVEEAEPHRAVGRARGGPAAGRARSRRSRPPLRSRRRRRAAPPRRSSRRQIVSPSSHAGPVVPDRSTCSGV